MTLIPRNNSKDCFITCNPKIVIKGGCDCINHNNVIKNMNKKKQMNIPKIKFIKTDFFAILPEKNNSHPLEGDIGYDLFAIEDTIIPARGSAVVPVGIKVGFIEPGYWFKIEARSGNGFKKGLEPHPGIIDNSYRGDLGVKLFNFTDQDQIIEKHKGAAQFVIYKMVDSEVEWMEESDLINTSRGEKGFGSSDSK